MNLTAPLTADRREHVERRLRTDLMAWLTTVLPNGQPESVPLWFFLQDDGTFVIFSQPDKLKLRNIDNNPHVALGLDGTDLGRDIIRIEGTATRAGHLPAADRMPGFVAKYAERIARVFGTAEEYAREYSVPVVITPSKLHA
ncbi:MAG: TIGR03667 family PPOX class F420-dependent oxidoreductase [Actinomycetota bacterium]|nr:TIGR03667 family PPOX class F420-dependent oxidoreductase [Actinomycetota bacterium]